MLNRQDAKKRRFGLAQSWMHDKSKNLTQISGTAKGLTGGFLGSSASSRLSIRNWHLETRRIEPGQEIQKHEFLGVLASWRFELLESLDGVWVGCLNKRNSC
jgi:hypothetical protein